MSTMRPSPSHPIARRSAGFGMVEVMVALLLVTIAATGGLAVLASTLAATQNAGAGQIATRLAQEKINLANAEPFARLGTAGPPASVCPCISCGATCNNETIAGGPNNQINFTRSCAVCVLLNGMKVLQVDVTWTDQKHVDSAGNLKVHKITLGAQRVL